MENNSIKFYTTYIGVHKKQLNSSLKKIGNFEEMCYNFALNKETPLFLANAIYDDTLGLSLNCEDYDED
jgi:hypothetical protein